MSIMINVQNKRKPMKRLWEPQGSYHSIEFLSEEHLLLLNPPMNHQRGILKMNIGRILQVRSSKAKSGCGTHLILSWHAWPPFGGSFFLKEILALVLSLLHICFQALFFQKSNFQMNPLTFLLFLRVLGYQKKSIFQ